MPIIIRYEYSTTGLHEECSFQISDRYALKFLRKTWTKSICQLNMEFLDNVEEYYALR